MLVTNIGVCHRTTFAPNGAEKPVINQPFSAGAPAIVLQLAHHIAPASPAEARALGRKRLPKVHVIDVAAVGADNYVVLCPLPFYLPDGSSVSLCWPQRQPQPEADLKPQFSYGRAMVDAGVWDASAFYLANGLPGALSLTRLGSQQASIRVGRTTGIPPQEVMLGVSRALLLAYHFAAPACRVQIDLGLKLAA